MSPCFPSLSFPSNTLFSLGKWKYFLFYTSILLVLLSKQNAHKIIVLPLYKQIPEKSQIISPFVFSIAALFVPAIGFLSFLRIWPSSNSLIPNPSSHNSHEIPKTMALLYVCMPTSNGVCIIHNSDNYDVTMVALFTICKVLSHCPLCGAPLSQWLLSQHLTCQLSQPSPNYVFRHLYQTLHFIHIQNAPSLYFVGFLIVFFQA